MSSLRLDDAPSARSNGPLLAVAPTLVERLDDYLERRRRSGIPVSTGESVTLVVAVLRARLPASPGAGWWLTADGRPVLVEKSGTDAHAARTREVLDTLRELSDPSVRGLIEEVRDAVAPAPSISLTALEHRAFAVATPRPLVLGPLIPVPDPEDPATARGAPASVWALVDADLRVAVVAAVREARERWRLRRSPDTPPRRAVLAAVVGVTVIVAVAVGVLIPSGSEPSSTPAVGAAPTASASPPSGPATSDGTVPPAGGLLAGPADSEAADDPLDAVQTVLAAYAACGGDERCTSGLRESAPGEGEVAPADPSRGTVALIEDFGDLAVVRIDTEREHQFVTLVRSDDRWLVRAARAVTDQPS